MKNEHGFIMPIVIILSFLFIAFILHQIEVLTSDHHFLLERKNYFLHDPLLQMASSDMLSILEKSDTMENVNGKLEYDPGNVLFKVTEHDEATVTIQLTSTTEFSGKRDIFILYDRSIKRITQWTE